jgi:hypothetical protein
MRSLKVFGVIVALIVLGVLLQGCDHTTSAKPGVTLQLGADTARGSRSTSIVAPLDAGAVVTAYDFRTGSVIATRTTNAAGLCSLDITSGLTVVIETVGTRLGKNYRLSRIIALVPNADGTFIMSPTSTLASEALCQQFYKKGDALDATTVAAVEAAAATYVAGHPSADFSLGGGLLNAGSTLGSATAIDATALASVIAAVPASVVSNDVLAKNAVQQLKEFGLPWASVVSTEQESLKTAGTQVNATIDAIDLDDVKAKYTALGDRLDTLLMPLFADDDFKLGGSWKHFTDLTIGKGYLATEVTTSYGWRYLSLTQNDAYNIAGQITVKLVKGGGTYTVVAKLTNSNTTWDITQTFTGDSLQNYHIVKPVDNPVLGTNPSLTASISLTDKDVTTPMTFTGTLSAIGPDKDHYTSISYNGTLDSGEIKATANMVVVFPATLPTGVPSGAKIYDYPTSFTLSNAAITVQSGQESAHIAGNITATAQPVTLDGKLVAMPTQFNITQATIQVASGANSATIKGDITVKGHYVAQAGADDLIVPEDVTLSGSITLVDHGHTIALSGDIAANGGQLKTYNGKQMAVPNHVRLHGAYSNSDSSTALDGTMEATWENPGSTLQAAKGNLTMLGTLTRASYHAYDIDFAATADGTGRASCAVNKIAFGGFSLAGTLSGPVRGESAEDIVISLTNQDGVIFAKAQGVTSGTVKIGTTQVGTITCENDMFRVNYNDGTHDYYSYYP